MGPRVGLTRRLAPSKPKNVGQPARRTGYRRPLPLEHVGFNTPNIGQCDCVNLDFRNYAERIPQQHPRVVVRDAGCWPACSVIWGCNDIE